ncbi:MAG TPA: choice-of-anchor Q domain-containing protein [Solirubrobacterales bacterium]
MRSGIGRRLVVAQVGAVLAVLSFGLGGPAASPARADTYCTPGPCSEGTPVATIHEAVAMAHAHAGPDTVAIQPGTYETQAEACGGLYVEDESTSIRGAGIDQTILTFPAMEPTAGFGRNVICGFMHLSNLTLRLPSDVTPGQNSSVEGLDLYGGAVEHVKVDAVGASIGPGVNDGRAQGMLLRGGTAHDIEVDFAPTQDSDGIQTGYLTEISNVTVHCLHSAFSSRVNEEASKPPMRVSHVILHGSRPLTVLNETGFDSRMELSDAVLDASAATPTQPSVGVAVENGLPPHTIELAMDRVTVVGDGGPESLAMEVAGLGGTRPTVLEARHLIATGFAKTMLLGLHGSGVTAKVDYSNLDLSPGAVTQEGTEGTATTTFGPGNRAGNPLLVAPASGDYRLSAGSPAIDIGGPDLIGRGPTDLGGNPRPVDGDGDGVALIDAGAFEYQPQPSPPPPPSPPADREARIEILGKRLPLSSGGVVSVSVRCPSEEVSPPCRGSVTLRTAAKLGLGHKRHRLFLGNGTYSVGAGQVAAVRIKLPGSRADLLRGEPAARRVVASAQVSDALGNQGTAQKQMKIAPAHRRHG